MSKNNNNGNALSTVSTRKNADAIPVNETGVLDGITMNGEPVRVWYHVDEKTGNVRSVDVLHSGNAGQIYVENKPKPVAGNATSEKFDGPRIAVNGKTRPSVNHAAGKFSDSVNGPNSMPRKITMVVVENATITTAKKKTITLDGTWTIIGMVKYDHKRNDGRTYHRILVKRGKNIVVKTVNG